MLFLVAAGLWLAARARGGGLRTSPLGVALRAALPAVLSDVSRDYLSLPAPEDAAPPPEPGT